MTINKKNGHLTRFNEIELLDKIIEFKGYFDAKKTLPKLNPDKLINFLHIYFRAVLTYPLPETIRIIIKSPDHKFYQIEFSGHNKEGDYCIVSLADMSDTLISEVCSYLLKTANSDNYNSLIELFTRALLSQSLEKRHKFNIINAENKILKERFSDALLMMPEERVDEVLQVRKKLVYSELSELAQTTNSSRSYGDENIEALYGFVFRYVWCKINTLIAKNKFVDVFQFLYNELEVAEDQKIVVSILNYLVLNNNLFLLEKKETIQDKIVEKKTLIGEENYEHLEEALRFSPEKIDIKTFSLELADNIDGSPFKFNNVDYLKVKTIISFVVPCKSFKEYVVINSGSDYTIEFIKVNNLFDDPIFLFLNNLQHSISGMPTTIFSDAVGNLECSTVVRICLNDFFHPDFDLVDDRICYLDFEDKEAILGRKYYPHKDKVVEVLRLFCKQNSDRIPFEIKKEDININLISNYLVNYIDEDGGSIFHQVHTITNLDSYLKVKNRYLEKIARLNLEDQFLDIRKLMFDTDIVTPSSLREYIIKTIDLIVVKAIELRGIYRYLWKGGSYCEPLNEIDIQPIIKTHLQPILEAKGIQISREIVAANGSLDFLCTYTHNGALFKVGIELKKAHHEKLLNGLTEQLPQYLRDEGTKYGIFLVLWFKNMNFMQPVKYETIDALKNDLQTYIPQEYKFDIIAIDCTKKNITIKEIIIYKK